MGFLYFCVRIHQAKSQWKQFLYECWWAIYFAGSFKTHTSTHIHTCGNRNFAIFAKDEWVVNPFAPPHLLPLPLPLRKCFLLDHLNPSKQQVMHACFRQWVPKCVEDVMYVQMNPSWMDKVIILTPLWWKTLVCEVLRTTSTQTFSDKSHFGSS